MLYNSKLIISHRGNLSGNHFLEKENTVDYILTALSNGFHCEIDVWYSDGWYLGHDKPEHPIPFEFLQIPKLWCHCKNVEALAEILSYNKTTESKIICVWIDKDLYPLTSNGYIWTHQSVSFPENLTSLSIAILPETQSTKEDFLAEVIAGSAGVCTDNPVLIQKIVNDMNNKYLEYAC